MKALHALPRIERYFFAGDFVGRRVRILEHAHRDRAKAHEHVGVLVSVARSNIGTGTDFAVIRFDGDVVDRAFSLATVFSIEAVS